MIEALINFSAMVFVSLVVFYIFDNMYKYLLEEVSNSETCVSIIYINVCYML